MLFNKTYLPQKVLSDSWFLPPPLYSRLTQFFYKVYSKTEDETKKKFLKHNGEKKTMPCYPKKNESKI